MNSRLLTLSIVLMTLSLVGCLPEKRVLWSPDGKRALVRGDDGLYVCDADGRLSPRLAERVGAVAWLPDSHAVILSRSEPAASWAEMAAVMAPDRRAEIEARGPRLRDELLSHEGDWDAFKPQSVKGLSGGEALALFLYVRERHSTGLPEKLGDKWDELKKIDGAITLLQRARVGDDGGLAPCGVLRRDVDAFEELRGSPTGKVIAFRRPMGDEDSTQRVYCVPLDGSAPPRAVAQRTSLFFDWSPDGRFLVYAATRGPLSGDSDELRLGTLMRQRVCGDDGALLTEMPEPQELAGLVFQREVRVRCLRDGRILFASLEMQLPCTAKDMPQRAGLFAVDPERHPGVTRLISRQVDAELPDAVVLFEVSPDEQRVSIPGLDGRVVVLTLANGEVCEVVKKEDVDRLRTEPSWRSDNELCVAVVPRTEGRKERAQIALVGIEWTNCTTDRRILSAAWPDTAIAGLLAEKPQPEPAAPPPADAPPE